MQTKADLLARIAELEAEKAEAAADKMRALEERVAVLEQHVEHYRAEAYRNAEIGKQIAAESEAEINRIRAMWEAKQNGRP